MIKSMTGFGRNELNDGKRNILVEIKSVNHRYCDITIKMSRKYSFAEEKLKSIVKQVAKRGKVDLSISVENITESDTHIKLNRLAASQYYENLKELKQEFDVAGDVSLSLLASMPDVIKAVPDIEDEEELLESLSKSVKEAVDKFDEMRKIEGEKLSDDILMRGRLIEDMRKEIWDMAPSVAKEYQAKLQDRIRDLLGTSVEIPEERIAVEAAIFADKSNITEELVRLASHLSQLEGIISNSNAPEGKKLDFLAQEMNREVNTIGAKANEVKITNLIIGMKSEIEKIREQIQNVE